MSRVNLDLDVLRSFAAGIELGSFAKAADRLNRSTSAVSAQLKKLEEQAGTPLLRKAGRGMALTEAGEVMLGYARRLLELNDEAVSAVRGVQLQGCVRLGLQEDFGESVLPTVLGRFRRAHPRLRVDVQLARNPALMQGLQTGQLDLALAWETGQAAPHAEHVHTLPMRWIAGGDELAYAAGEPLPLVVLDAPCLMRSAATQALDRAGLPWRIAFTSPSLAGTWAAVKAGLGVSVRTPWGLPAELRVLETQEAQEARLPPLPQLGLALYRREAEPEPAVARLAELIMQKLGESIAA